jgi:D-glycero-beta-D-manno-heptose 1-phosphate adenylyltransferase
MTVILDHQTLAEQVDAAKAEGKTVVFTNGAFDLLHVGHIRYLQGAAQLGDLTVCALNSDASVRRLKGEGRPVVSLEHRMEIVAALECIDRVTSFDEPTVENLLLLLKPDIHAKGTDYTEDSVPEVEIVRSYGGKVAITGDPKDHDTTKIIGEIRNREEKGA